MDVLFFVGWLVCIHQTSTSMANLNFIEVTNMTPEMFYGWSMLKYVDLKLFGNQSKIWKIRKIFSFFMYSVKNGGLDPTSKRKIFTRKRVRIYLTGIYIYICVQQATKENNQSIVNASFHVTQWNVSPFGTGLSRLKNQPCVFGGDVLRFEFIKNLNCSNKIKTC